LSFTAEKGGGPRERGNGPAWGLRAHRNNGKKDFGADRHKERGVKRKAKNCKLAGAKKPFSEKHTDHYPSKGEPRLGADKTKRKKRALVAVLSKTTKPRNPRVRTDRIEASATQIR